MGKAPALHSWRFAVHLRSADDGRSPYPEPDRAGGDR